MNRTLGVLVLGLAACTSPHGAPRASTEAPLSAIRGPAVALCSNGAAGPVCVLTATPGYPLAIATTVTALDPYGVVVSTANLDDGAPHSLVGAGLDSASTVTLRLTTSLSSSAGGTALGELARELVLSPSQSATLELPFSLWPVRLRGTASLDDVAISSYDVSVAPWQVAKAPIAVQSPVVGSKRAGAVVDALFVVSPGATHIDGSADFCDANACKTLPFVIDGAGTFDVTSRGLVRVGGAPSADPSLVRELGPFVPPVPSCGANEEAPCIDHGVPVCDDHTVLLDGRCFECGGDDDPACPGAEGALVCDPGMVLLDGECETCGVAGRPACDPAVAAPCIEGTQETNGICAPCGGAGQPECSSVNGLACNPGTVAVGAVCMPCGADEEPACTDRTDGELVCNVGFRMLDGICHYGASSSAD